MINYARDHTIADGLDYIGVWNAAMLSGAHMQRSLHGESGETRRRFPRSSAAERQAASERQAALKERPL